MKLYQTDFSPRPVNREQQRKQRKHTWGGSMERQRYIVRLSSQDRQELENIVKKGKGGAFKIRHAQILLHAPGPLRCEMPIKNASL